MSIEEYMKTTLGWQSVTEIEVMADQRRCKVIREMNRLARAGKVERRKLRGYVEYRWKREAQL